MVFSFKVYIWPLLEYCSPIWSPCKLHDIDPIESVQRSFTKKLEGLHDLPYAERLIACNLPSLKLRRLWADLVLCFKIIHKQISLLLWFFEFDSNSHCTRGHRLKLRLPFVKSKIRKSLFANRIIPVWNALPHDVVNVTCCTIFKHKLKTLDLNKFYYVRWLLTCFYSFPMCLLAAWLIVYTLFLTNWHVTSLYSTGVL